MSRADGEALKGSFHVEALVSDSPPRAARRPQTFTHLERSWSDDLAWLKDRTDPEVIAHLEAENAHTEAATAHLAALRQALYDEMLGRIREDDADPPYRKGPWAYYTRTIEGKPYALHCRRPAAGGDEQVLLDENERAEGSAYYALGALAVSPDHRWLALAEDRDGSEKYTIRFKDLDSGTIDEHAIVGAKTSLAWANDSRHLFYTLPDATDRPYQLIRHDRTHAQTDDVLVFEEPDAAFFLGAQRSRDGRQIVVELESKITSEGWLIDASDPRSEPRCVRPRVSGVEYAVEPHGDVVYVLDNVGAPNFRLLRVPASALDAAPEVVLEHDPTTYLTGLDAFSDHLVVWLRRDGLSGLAVLALRTGAWHDVAFDEEAYVVRPERNAEYDVRQVRFTYESLVTPPSVFAYDMDTREREALKRTPVPNYDPSRYRTHRAWTTSADGTRVPMTLLYRAEVVQEGDNPALLAGYGAYGIDSEPWFRRTWLSLADRGVVCALAHTRGGSELGRPWYEAGKFLAKKNTFQDFIACAEALIAEQWTQPDRLGIWGGSAGGLLVGAALDLRPDLFRAALALVPFVDVVNTMLDESLPLTITEYEEWGDPRDPDYFEYIRSYAPYETVAPRPYPAVLATAGLNDPRVGFWEPTKWVQKMREHTTAGAPQLLKVHLGAGHAGASGRYGRLEEAAFEYAFLLDQLGANVPPLP